MPGPNMSDLSGRFGELRYQSAKVGGGPEETDRHRPETAAIGQDARPEDRRLRNRSNDSRVAERRGGCWVLDYKT